MCSVSIETVNNVTIILFIPKIIRGHQIMLESSDSWSVCKSLHVSNYNYPKETLTKGSLNGTVSI